MTNETSFGQASLWPAFDLIGKIKMAGQVVGGSEREEGLKVTINGLVGKENKK